jgi:TRAP-type C4-dicarboxylate transport system substrate-binding protein
VLRSRIAVVLMTVSTVSGLVVGCTGTTDKAGGSKGTHAVVVRVLTDISDAELQPYVDEVAGLSGGALRLEFGELFERTSVMREHDAILAMQRGQADLAILPVRAFRALGVTSFDALVAPLTIDSMALQRRVLASDLPARMLAGLDALGLRGLGILAGQMQKPYGITRALRGPADYRGATIGMRPSVVADRALRALGATPVASAFGGADIGSDDGIAEQLSSISGTYDGLVQALTENVNLWPRPEVVFTTAAAVRHFSDQQLGWLRAAARDSLDAMVRALFAGDAELLGPLCHSGHVQLITATTRQIAQLRAAFEPVYAWLRRDERTRNYLDEIDQLRAGGVTPYRQETLSCAGMTGSGGMTSAATPIDGVYEHSFTARELLADGSPDAAPENYGSFRWVLYRGQWELTQRSDRAATWTRGHYTVDGDRFTEYVDEAGGLAPTNANGRPGEHATLLWTLYHGVLRARFKNLNNVKPNAHMNVWRRVGDATAASTAFTTTPFDGTYRMVTTDHDAQSSDQDPTAHSWGEWTFIFSGGHFVYTQQNTLTCTWGYGIFVDTDDRVDWEFTGGGGDAPAGAVTEAGQDLRYGWSREDDDLTLAITADDPSPSYFVVEPWKRLSVAPEVSALSKRCPPPPQALAGL